MQHPVDRKDTASGILQIHLTPWSWQGNEAVGLDVTAREVLLFLKNFANLACPKGSIAIKSGMTQRFGRLCTHQQRANGTFHSSGAAPLSIEELDRRHEHVLTCQNYCCKISMLYYNLKLNHNSRRSKFNGIYAKTSSMPPISSKWAVCSDFALGHQQFSPITYDAYKLTGLQINLFKTR